MNEGKTTLDIVDERGEDGADLNTNADSPLLKEVRDRYLYASNAWKDIKDEAAKDMRYVTGHPWSTIDEGERRDQGRPALALDTLGQYVNQAKNQLRQNPRGIKIDPVGQGANDQSAEFLQNLIRGIEYDSNAQRNAYTPAAESQLQRSYGFFRITRRVVPGTDGLQAIHIKGILNPDSVIYDPDYSEADWSDAMYCFVVDPIPWDSYRQRWPNAVKHSFDLGDNSIAPEWIQEKSIMVAEYWRVKQDKDGKRTVTQYMTNGVEILEKKPELGSYIPIVPVVGREMYVTEGGKTERKIFSMIRLARDPYMLSCYLWSQMAEEAKLTPKVPFVGAKGQFESDKTAWDRVTSQPTAYVQYDPVVDGATGQVLPPPARPQFSPNFQAYLQAIDGANRATMSAMGIAPLPTAAQRNTEKSGVALERIETQQNIGVFDFTDNFDRSLHLTGRILLEWIPRVYTTERYVGIVSADGSRKVVKINTKDPYTPDATPQNPTPKPEHYPVIDDEGNPVADHGVTIDTGPSYESQREATSAFLDQLVTMLPNMPPPGTPAAKVLSMAIRARNLGPKGNQIADIIEGDQQQQAGLQAQQQIPQMTQLIQELQVELQKLQQEKAGKVVEHQGKMEQLVLEQQNALDLEDKKLLTQVTVAEINTKAQSQEERISALEELMQQFHQQAHETAMQAADHQQAQVVAQQQAEAAAQQQSQAQQHEVGMQQNQQQADQSQQGEPQQ